MPSSVAHTKGQMRELSPYEFEEFVAEVWSAQGFATTVRQQSWDRGIDVEARQDGVTLAIQVKQYGEGNTVGSQEVRNYATLYQQNETIDRVIIVTSAEFTTPAETLGRDLDVELVDGSQLAELALEYKIPITNFVKLTESPLANAVKVAHRLRIPCNDHFVKAWAKEVDIALSELLDFDIRLVDRITSLESETSKADVVLTVTLSTGAKTLVRDGFEKLNLNEPVSEYFDDQQGTGVDPYILSYDLSVRQVVAILGDSGKLKSALSQIEAHREQSDPSTPFLLGYLLLRKSFDWSLLRLVQE
ncbi:restriction endonuclease [Halorubrum halophilum]|uniref:restriction endonuclease n=1 Tax=Halorubrum halophilum TaxID=413816 RepID=UPI000679327F|nr:restriction endonuclease [Halorubrum halophilum]